MKKIIIVTVFLLYNNLASADSDGYFCVGPSYFAYELSHSVIPYQHSLHIVSFTNSSIWRNKAVVPIPEFQTHGMACNQSSVVLHGWDSKHTITWEDHILSSKHHEESVLASEAKASRESKRVKSIFNEKPQTRLLYEDDENINYALIVTDKQFLTPQPCKKLRDVKIVLSENNKELEKLYLFQGKLHQECADRH